MTEKQTADGRVIASSVRTWKGVAVEFARDLAAGAIRAAENGDAAFFAEGGPFQNMSALIATLLQRSETDDPAELLAAGKLLPSLALGEPIRGES